MEDVRRLPVGEVNEGNAVTLDELARDGARRMIATALEAEVCDYIERFAEERDADGKRLVVRKRSRRPAPGHDRVGDRAGPGAARQRQARRRADRRAPAVQLADLAGVCASLAEGQRRAAGALPAW